MNNQPNTSNLLKRDTYKMIKRMEREQLSAYIVVNISCNAENISNSTVVQANKAETIHVENKVQINSNNGGGDE